MVRRKETEIHREQTGWKERVRSFLQSGKGRVIACACAAAIVLLIVVTVVLLTRGNSGDELPENWPTVELMEGIQPPEQGKIASIHQTDTSVTVYFEEFSESALAAYLQTLGASPAGGFTYVAQKGEDRILAVVYDPTEKRLSLTVTSTK